MFIVYCLLYEADHVCGIEHDTSLRENDMLRVVCEINFTGTLSPRVHCEIPGHLAALELTELQHYNSSSMTTFAADINVSRSFNGQTLKFRVEYNSTFTELNTSLPLRVACKLLRC